jgi:hypothetical protein
MKAAEGKPLLPCIGLPVDGLALQMAQLRSAPMDLHFAGVRSTALAVMGEQHVEARMGIARDVAARSTTALACRWAAQ